MEVAVLAAVSDHFSETGSRSDKGIGSGLEQRLVTFLLWLVRRLPNGGLRARALLGLVRFPGVARVEVQYLLDNIPLTVSLTYGQSHYRLDLHESIFHFNSMLGWHLGLHRQDVEREPVRIVFGKYQLVRQSIPGRFEGFVIAKRKWA